jgi:hypothetical protein
MDHQELHLNINKSYLIRRTVITFFATIRWQQNSRGEQLFCVSLADEKENPEDYFHCFYFN